MKSRNEQIFLGREIIIHYLYGEDGTFAGKTGYVTSVDNDGNLFGIKDCWGIVYFGNFLYISGVKLKQKNMEDKDLICFEVETTYKSGYLKNEVLTFENEEQMWQYYDKHHNKDIIISSTIIDAWCA